MKEQQQAKLGVDVDLPAMDGADQAVLDAEELRAKEGDGPEVPIPGTQPLQPDVDPIAKSDEGNRTTKGQFGRKKTHNEQLVVYCCGVIGARATMFGAEAITGVKVGISVPLLTSLSSVLIKFISIVGFPPKHLSQPRRPS